MQRRAIWMTMAGGLASFAAVDKCACDPADAASLNARECSLTKEALKQPGDLEVFFIKDASPRKPNRTLAMPRRIVPSVMQELKDLTPKERTTLWKAAIEKSEELWGEEWGVAYNGINVRTQCHLHIHIGKLLKGVDSGEAILVNRIEDIPVPMDGTGLWIHPAGKRLKVHIKEQICETVLFR